MLDPEGFPARSPRPAGLAPDKLYDLLEAVAEDCELVGLEVTAFEAPEDERRAPRRRRAAMHVIEPLLDAIPEESSHCRRD